MEDSSHAVDRPNRYTDQFLDLAWRQSIPALADYAQSSPAHRRGVTAFDDSIHLHLLLLKLFPDGIAPGTVDSAEEEVSLRKAVDHFVLAGNIVRRSSMILRIGAPMEALGAIRGAYEHLRFGHWALDDPVSYIAALSKYDDLLVRQERATTDIVVARDKHNDCYNGWRGKRGIRGLSYSDAKGFFDSCTAGNIVDPVILTEAGWKLLHVRSGPHSHPMETFTDIQTLDDGAKQSKWLCVDGRELFRECVMLGKFACVHLICWAHLFSRYADTSSILQATAGCQQGLREGAQVAVLELQQSH